MGCGLSRKVDPPLAESSSTPQAWWVRSHRTHDAITQQAFASAHSPKLNGVDATLSLKIVAPFLSELTTHRNLQRRGIDPCAKKVPFFELDVQLSVPSVRLSPTLEDVQTSVNAAAASVLGCAKRLYDWGEADVAEADRFSFFEALGSDLEIIKTVLLLTGASYGTAVQASLVFVMPGRRFWS